MNIAIAELEASIATKLNNMAVATSESRKDDANALTAQIYQLRDALDAIEDAEGPVVARHSRDDLFAEVDLFIDEHFDGSTPERSFHARSIITTFIAELGKR